MKKKYFFIWLILTYLNITNAIVVEEIYNVQVEVNSKEISKEQKTTIVQQEFSKILLKLTGKTTISIPITDAEEYVSKYEYQELNENVSKIFLKIHFDKNLIQQKLTDHKQLFLHEHRPVTIIWPKTSNPILTESIQELLYKITFVAKDYGLPVVYPVLNLKEVAILNKDLSDHDFVSLIKAASKRYDADEIIIANCDLNEDLLQINWRSLINHWEFKNQVIENYGSANIDLEPYAKLFVNKLMDHFINLYFGDPKTNKEVILLRITNINDLEDYVKIEKYLQSLAIVKHIYASGFKSNEVEFKITVIGGKQAMKNALATNRSLNENNYDNDNFYNNIITYNLNY